MSAEKELRKYINATHSTSETGQHLVTLPQALNLLEKAGMLGGGSKPGIQDDIDNAFRMYTDINPSGDLMAGMQSYSNPSKPPAYWEIYASPGCDLLGAIDTYFLKLARGFKHGVNQVLAKSPGKYVEAIKEAYDLKPPISVEEFSEKYVTVPVYEKYQVNSSGNQTGNREIIEISPLAASYMLPKAVA